jgi:hypothetical protein
MPIGDRMGCSLYVPSVLFLFIVYPLTYIDDCVTPALSGDMNYLNRYETLQDESRNNLLVGQQM